MRAGTASLKKALRSVRPTMAADSRPCSSEAEALERSSSCLLVLWSVISYIRLRRSHTSHCSTKSTITCGLHKHKRCLMHQLPKRGSRLVSRSAGQWLGRRAKDLPSAFLGCPMNMQAARSIDAQCVWSTLTPEEVGLGDLRCRSTSSRDTSDSADVEEPTGSQDTT